MLRSHILAGDEIGRESERLIKSGRLVPDELVNVLVEERLQQPDCAHGVILDGYPRTINQAEVLLKALATFGFRPGVVHLMVDYNRIIARLSGRRQCPVCGTLYSSKTNPPKMPGVCDLDGTNLITREDDQELVIRERLEQYDSQTTPILQYFEGAGVPVASIDAGEATPEQVSGNVCSALRSAGLLAAIPVDVVR